MLVRFLEKYVAHVWNLLKWHSSSKKKNVQLQITIISNQSLKLDYVTNISSATLTNLSNITMPDSQIIIARDYDNAPLLIFKNHRSDGYVFTITLHLFTTYKALD